MTAVVPPVAPGQPVSGGAPHFSAEIGAWRKPLQSAQRVQRGFVQRAANRPGNVTLSQRGKIWLAVILYCAACWGLFAWLVHDLYVGGGL